MTRSAQRAAPWPRLLVLCAALLLGVVTLHVVTLHAVGRPAGSHALVDVPAGHSVASAPAPAAEGGEPASGLAVLEEPALPVLGAGPAGARDAAPLGGAARVPGRSGGPRPMVLRI
ncbi:hypothetical protein ACFTWH_07960 [Streptomyces sp. NPDC057011]|uniref:hypothetical protein n=1 Tax=unclassified Streptomyces TaxID=2593676 RepID=UPI00362E3547